MDLHHSTFTHCMMILFIFVSEIKCKQNDFSAVLRQYFLTCGHEYLCYSTNMNTTILPTFEYRNVTQYCPDCYCDDDCMTHDDCCPDVYFSNPQPICLESTIIDELLPHIEKTGTDNYNAVHYYKVINSCPTGSNDTLLDMCVKQYEPTELLHLPFVTSYDLRLSFRNRYCAECNGVTNYTTWPFDMNCPRFYDPNFVSTYKGLFADAKNKKCIMMFVPPPSMEMAECERSNTVDGRQEQTSEQQQLSGTLSSGRGQESGQLISQLGKSSVNNQAGNRQYHVVTVKEACESTYSVKYGTHKNIFCYMMNVTNSSNSKPEVSRCNVTEVWTPYDDYLEHACLHYGTSAGTRPYKNVFCYLCNRQNDRFDQFIDANATVDSFSSNGFPKSYFVNITSFSPDYLSEILNAQQTVMNLSASITLDTPVNLTNVLIKYIAATGIDDICNIPTIVPRDVILFAHERHYCKCSPACLYEDSKTTRCCQDVILKYTSQCLSTAYFEDLMKPLFQAGRNFRVTNGCLKKTNIKKYEPLEQKCTQGDDTMYGSVPILGKSGIFYKNFYCLLCSDFDSAIEGEYKPMNIKFDCDVELNINYILKLQGIFDLAGNAKCQKGFQYQFYAFQRTQEVTYCKSLNQTSNDTLHILNEDQDIALACQNVIPQKYHIQLVESKNQTNGRSIFCQMNNEMYSNATFISTCNTTGNWREFDAHTVRACYTLPKISVMLPYKNWFCALCNGIVKQTTIHKQLEKQIRLPPPLIPPAIATSTSDMGIRLLFVMPTERKIKENLNRQICSENQVYDQVEKECRNQTCYPGKWLGTDGCVPLLTVTNNLRFSISVELTGSVTFNTDNVAFLLHDVIHNFLDTLSMVIGIFRPEKVDVFVQKSCERHNFTDTNMKLFFNAEFRMEESVNRLQVEKALLDFIYSRILVLHMNKNISFQLSPTLLPQRASSLLHAFDKNTYCRRIFPESLYYFDENFIRITQVRKLLLCKQIILDPGEFDFRVNELNLKLKRNGLVIHYDQFEIISGGRARVCTEDLKGYFIITAETVSNVQTVLYYLTLICLLTSMACLLLTFVTYTVVPQIRTLPGKNNMNLTFSLFCAQLFLFLVQFQWAPPVCISIGILLHYFWLASFLCMSVCCFHMSRVFGSSCSLNGYNQTTLLLKYSIMSYGLPFVVVSLNILITYSLFFENKGLGYGLTKCFIDDMVSHIVTFVIPILVVCFVNIFCFVITARGISKRPKIDCNREHQNEFVIYGKLFVLTGITWLFVILDALFPVSVFTFIVSILNCLQGVFIFASYICNARCISLIKKVIGKGQHMNASDPLVDSTSLSLRSSITKTTCVRSSSTAL